MQPNGSDVARLREQITLEHEAASRALTGTAEGAVKHAFITARMDQIGVYQEQLAALVGEKETAEFLVQVFEKSPAQQENAPMNEQPPHTYIGAHAAKLAFRAFLPMFAGYWEDARGNASEGSLNAAIWPDYYRLLRACQEVLLHAPMHPNEAQTVNIERRYVRSLEQLATTLAVIFPHGFMELETYVVTKEVQQWRRAAGLARYRRVKSRKRYRKGRGRR